MTAPLITDTFGGIMDSQDLQETGDNAMNTQPPPETSKDSLMAFAGVGRGLWGETPDAVNRTIRTLKDSWTR